ncbi:MAG: YceI family protein [Bacteriovoracaceae bacterium]|nr:YceI family protein [Bacteriovoracaceae bacterium]
MKIFLLSFCLIMFSVNSFAKVCTYEYVSAGTELKWKAFKTPKKLGVNGQFKDFSIVAGKASSLADLLAQAAFSINTQSVETGDKGRDGKIMKSFFSTLAQGLHIKGFTNKVTAKDDVSGQVEVEMSMNGEAQDVKMDYKLTDGKLTLTGKVDVLEFKMDKNLQAINKACFALHEGKTWSDVELELIAVIKTTCQ